MDQAWGRCLGVPVAWVEVRQHLPAAASAASWLAGTLDSAAASVAAAWGSHPQGHLGPHHLACHLHRNKHIPAVSGLVGSDAAQDL